MIEIRKLNKEDYRKFFETVNILDIETNNRAFEPGERNPSSEVFEAELLNKSKNGNIVIIATEAEEIIGYIEGERGNFRRNAHLIHFNIAIKLKYTGKGVGKLLITEFEKECLFNKIERIELTVFCDNVNAVKLYKKMGYCVEGTKINSFKIAGVSKNEYLMAKSLKKV